MAISKYFDETLNKECFRIQIKRTSPTNSKMKVRKRVFKIETMAEAQKMERQLNIQIERELVSKENQSCLWLTLVEDFEMAIRGKDIFARPLSKHSLDDYINVIRTYTSDWFKLRVEDIDKAKAWLLMDRVDREVSISRRKKLRTAIDAVYRWGLLSGRISKNVSLPTEGYKSTRKEEEKLPEILNLEEIRLLLKYAKEIKHLWYPIWAMALYTGMRSGELFALEWSSADFDNKMIYVHRNWTSKEGFGPTKGRYWRAVPMSEQMIPFLKELKLRTGNTKFVLPRFSSWEDGRQAELLREFCIGCGLPSIRFHTLRACFATQLIKDGIAPAVVMKICGWRDLKTMQRYIRLAGIEVKGATDGLKLLPEEEVMGRVLTMFNGQ